MLGAFGRCGGCGSPVEAGDRFCTQCGRPAVGPAVMPVGQRLYPPSYNPSPQGRHGRFMGLLLDEVLGSGAMGTVYYGVNPRSCQAFAVKILDSSAQFGTRAIARFEQEARFQAELVHPNVVRMFWFSREGRDCGLVMEYVPGPSLAHEMEPRRQGFPVELLVPLACDVLRGLYQVHQRSMVHRDLKPANILLAPEGPQGMMAKLADFGIATSLRDELAQQGDGGLAGTIPYMAPEQVHRKWPISVRTDLFAFGTVLYEMSTGHHPFCWDDVPDTVVMERVVSHVPGDPREKAPSLPAAVAEVILRCLQKRPEDRPASAEEVEQAIARTGRGW